MIQFDEHIFQLGWFNHQLEKLLVLSKRNGALFFVSPKNFVEVINVLENQDVTQQLVAPPVGRHGEDRVVVGVIKGGVHVHPEFVFTC